MEAVGLAFAAFSLFSELEACSKSLCRFSRDIRMAKEEVKLLRYEIANCRLLASIFEEVITPIQNNVMRLARENKLDQRLREQSKLAHNQIREITHKLQPLHRGKSTGFEKFQAKIRWHFMKGDFQFPMATLGSVKASLHLLTTLSLLDSAVANFLRVPNSDSTRKSQALDKITALEKQTRRTERQFSDSMRVLLEQGYLDQNPDNAGNIRVIAVTIKDIKRGTVKDARDLVKRFTNQHQVKSPTDSEIPPQLTSADDMYSQSAPLVRTSRYPSAEDHLIVRLNDPSLRSRTLARDSIRTPTNEPTPVGSELELRQKPRHQTQDSPHSSNLVMVESELEPPVSHASHSLVTDTPYPPDASPSIYQAMPPFNASDLRDREIRNRRRQSRSRSQMGE
ncbi:uncharacterized protein N7479_001825 [Penicillium vulpinum]|uniref:Fungal N-terminal domain-containing protein n=1 Tax=Penicillium vulpinum TaxID=29845 RepID=A0A1V6S562_9EURO|nr:uncharacterized protein N7479_001825 [Penicillium vulpinum]KAJ5971907.1 hypothetical protein N7479_001825 [Penicillium vulpinum]OQE08859.1 hypothetical protein PENVUL_c008G00851 [Penicillium vulpinum]